jgi:hypothetical protein
MGVVASSHRNVVLLSLSVLTLALMAESATARPGGHHQRARLILLDAKLKGWHYGVRGESTTITFEDVVKNVGGSRARSTRTELTLFPTSPNGEDQGIPVMNRRVPALDPHNSHAATTSRSFRVTNESRLGAYNVRICADSKLKVNQADDPNTCELLKKAFFIVKREWTGSFHGAYPYGTGVTEKWTSDNARFVLEG